MVPPELKIIQRRRRALILALCLVIVTLAVGFGVVVYPWDLVQLAEVSVSGLLTELTPLTALLLITVFFLADATKQTGRHEAAEAALWATATAGPAAALRRAADLLAEELARRGRRVDVAVSADLPAVAASSEDLCRVAVGMLLAFTAASPGSGDLCLSLAAETPGRLRLRVADDAAPVAAPRPLAQDEARDLGLATTLGAVRGLGGEMSATPATAGLAALEAALPAAHREG